MPFLTPQARRRRRAAGHKTGEFADKIRISRSHLVNAENGGQPVSEEVAFRIANELPDTNVADIIEYRERTA